MKVRYFLSFFLLFSTAVYAQSIGGFDGIGPRLGTGGLAGGGTGANPYMGPGDIVSAATSWWGLRAYNGTLASAGATTTKVLDVRGVTSGACTIFLLGNGSGGLDLATSGAGGVGNQCVGGATTFCTVTNTSCTISKLYDQVGSNPLVQATAAAQPTFSINGGPSSLPSISFTQNTTYLAVASFSTTTNQPFSVSHISNMAGLSANSRDFFRSAAAAAIIAYFNGVDAVYTPYAGSFLSFAASDGANHAIESVFNSSSSAFMIDGSDNTAQNPGTNIFATATDVVYLNDVVQSTSLTFTFQEIGVWPVAFSAGTRTNMNSNQHTYWGF